MKCLTFSESEEWLRSFGIRLNDDRSIQSDFEECQRVQYLISDHPAGGIKLVRFVNQMVEWLPNDCARMLWIDDWETYPRLQWVFFEIVRRDCGEMRQLIDAPGHLFPSFRGGRDAFLDSKENAQLCGLVLLLFCYGWCGYLISGSGKDYIKIGDSFVAFHSTSKSHLDRALKLLNSFKFNVKMNTK